VTNGHIFCHNLDKDKITAGLNGVLPGWLPSKPEPRLQGCLCTCRTSVDMEESFLKQKSSFSFSVKSTISSKNKYQGSSGVARNWLWGCKSIFLTKNIFFY
jgi:hypothetical protein